MSQDLTLPELVATMDYQMERGRWPTYENGHPISMKTISSAFRSPESKDLSPEDRETFAFRRAQAASWGGWGKLTAEEQIVCDYTRRLDIAIADTAKTNDAGNKTWPWQMPWGMETTLTARQAGLAIVNSQEYQRLPENEQKKAANYAARLHARDDEQYEVDQRYARPGVRSAARRLRYGERGAELKNREDWEKKQAKDRRQQR